MPENLAWAEHEFFHVKKAIGAELSKEIGDDKGPALRGYPETWLGKRVDLLDS
jgi:hypothetical protein